jgi:pyruvate formate lyase activating enzyme
MQVEELRREKPSGPAELEAALDLSLASGGSIKFDLKCWTEPLHAALTGAPNGPTLASFRRAAEWVPWRPSPPLVLAITLLVPGYVGAEEAGKIAAFIASLDPGIPYSILAFHPDFLLDDLPATSRAEAEEALAAARAAGLADVHLGNEGLLRAG